MTTFPAGLNETQFGHAKGIVRAVVERKEPKRRAVIAVETALAESGLRMYANAFNQESLDLPHEDVGTDHASVGLFQQQVGGAPHSTADWGTTAELMDAKISAGKFLDALDDVDWVHMTNWAAAQTVQRSAYDGHPRDENNFNSEFGGNYHDQDASAVEIVDAIWRQLTQPEQNEEEGDEMLYFTITTDGGRPRGFITGPKGTSEVDPDEVRRAAAMVGRPVVETGIVNVAGGRAALERVLG